MSKRKLMIAAGALVLVGGAAAIAAVGHREGRMADRDRMLGMDEFAQGPGHGSGMGGPGMREGRWGGRAGRGGDDPQAGADMRRGWLSRSVTVEEFETRTRERFARLDKNSDGVIDAAEVEAEIGRAGEGRGPMREAMRKRVEGRFDANRDGKITRQEALDRVRREFSRMDLDGDGRITDADLPPAMRGRGVLKGEAMPMMGRGPGGGMGHGMGAGGMGGGMMLGRLIEADANKDGVITLDEVLAGAGRRFDLADRNNDGVVDNADRDTLRKETAEYRVRRFMHAYGAAKEGRVTREQFFATAKERFAERDLNNDGRIDRQDMGRGRGPDRDRERDRDANPPAPGGRDRDPPR